MTVEQVINLRDELGNVLFDPDVPVAPDIVAVHATATFSDVQSVLEKYFRTPGAAYAVTVVAAGEQLGVVSRKSLGKPGMTAGDPGARYEVGDGDRLTLPGFSTRYRLLQFRCRQCAAQTTWIHCDTRGLPACQQGHRDWEFQR